MANGETVKVGVIMGSDSDLGVMQHVGRALRDSGMVELMDYEDRVISAHRTPEEMAEYAASAEARGLQVIVAGAGGSAHLPGMVASETNLPVLGIAITSHPSDMNRALGSMIGMPEGKPLATFQGPVGAYNAGRFATRVLALSTSEASRVAVAVTTEAEFDTMQHVGRALESLGLVDEEDYDEYVLETGKDVYEFGEDIKERAIGVVVGSSTSSHQLPRHLVRNPKIDVPILGVAIAHNPDVMTGGLQVMVDTAFEDEPVGAFQGAAGAFNAGLHAARIIALRSPELRARYQAYNEDLRWTVLAKDKLLRNMGAQAYLALGKDELQEMVSAERAKFTNLAG